MSKVRQRILTGFLLALCVVAPSNVLPQNVQDLEHGFLRQSGDDILNAQGKVVPPKASSGEEASDSVPTESDGIDVFTPSSKSNGNSDLNIESHAGCTWWWVSGYDSYSWKSYIFYLKAKFYSSSTTTYGTSTGSCGEPLYVDRLYLKATEFPKGTAYYTWFEKTGYNTSFIDYEDVRYLYSTSGVPAPCGINGYHEAYHHGVTWSVTVKVGCAT